MAIKGSLKEASLPDVIQLLFLGRRTGCLALADQHNFGTIYLDEGLIVYASIVNRRDRLGDILLRKGRISAEQLQQAMSFFTVAPATGSAHRATAHRAPAVAKQPPHPPVHPHLASVHHAADGVVEAEFTRF